MVALAGLFVQVTSLYQITTQTEMLGFTGGSIVFKLLVQESIKMYVIKRNIKDIRTMCLGVGLPTALIDVQLRIALLRARVSGLALSGMSLMELAEICMRTAKVVCIKYEIRCQARAMSRPEVAVASRQVPSQETLGRKPSQDSNPIAPPQRRTSTASSLRFLRWKHKLLAFHAAEIYADMSAEYIAIGCSSAILYFYWDHPKYELAVNASAATTNNSAIAMWSAASAQMPLLGIQLGAEIVVDSVALVLEISGGIDFDEIYKHGLFVACAFVTVTIINTTTSAMYMRVNSGPN